MMMSSDNPNESTYGTNGPKGRKRTGADPTALTPGIPSLPNAAGSGAANPHGGVQHNSHPSDLKPAPKAGSSSPRPARSSGGGAGMRGPASGPKGFSTGGRSMGGGGRSGQGSANITRGRNR